MDKRRVAVLGFGRTGRALLDHLLDHEPGSVLSVYNDTETGEKEPRAGYEAKGVRFLIGGENFNSLLEMDMIILSPGFDGRNPRFSPLRRRSIEIISEIEYAFRFTDASIVAVSGTNGKSTTVSLIHHLLVRNGRQSILAGNIGIPFISFVETIRERSEPCVAVLEISSFQLEEIRRFRPGVAVLLNITSDHLDRYPTMDDYVAAKMNLFQNQKSTDTMVLNADDALIAANRPRLGKGRPLWFSLTHQVESGAYLEGVDIVIRRNGIRTRVSLKNNPLQGIHNLENILASVLAVSALGLDAAGIENALGSFRGLPHRMELVGAIDGVRFVNDSKATNIDAALKSIGSFSENLVLILGGKDKSGDFRPLEKPLCDRARSILLIGKAAGAIAGQLPGLADRMIFVKDLREAVETGLRLLRGTGGTVLLAPACASFDMFRDFEDRGEVFAREVQELKNRVKRG